MKLAQNKVHQEHEKLQLNIYHFVISLFENRFNLNHSSELKRFKAVAELEIYFWGGPYINFCVCVKYKIVIYNTS